MTSILPDCEVTLDGETVYLICEPELKIEVQYVQEEVEEEVVDVDDSLHLQGSETTAQQDRVEVNVNVEIDTDKDSNKVRKLREEEASLQTTLWNLKVKLGETHKVLLSQDGRLEVQDSQLESARNERNQLREETYDLKKKLATETRIFSRDLQKVCAAGVSTRKKLETMNQQQLNTLKATKQLNRLVEEENRKLRSMLDEGQNGEQENEDDIIFVKEVKPNLGGKVTTAVAKKVLAKSQPQPKPSTSRIALANPPSFKKAVKETQPEAIQSVKRENCVEFRFKCNQCKMTFLKKSFLMAHQRRKHQVNGIKVTCEKCKVSFNSQKELDQHQKKTHECGNNFQLVSTSDADSTMLELLELCNEDVEMEPPTLQPFNSSTALVPSTSSLPKQHGINLYNNKYVTRCLCGERFGSYCNLIMHVRRMNGKKRQFQQVPPVLLPEVPMSLPSQLEEIQDCNDLDEDYTFQRAHSSNTNGNSNNLAPHVNAPLKREEILCIVGKDKGIQGYKNSCYLDATLFAMFSFSGVFDSVLLQQLNTYNLTPEGEEFAFNVQRILREEIVNPLRKNLYCPADNVMKLRRMMGPLDTKLTSEEMDPEEFLNLLFGKVLYLEEFMSLSSGHTEFLHQILAAQTERSADQVPSIQQIFRESLNIQEVRLKCIPKPALILQTPRYGNQYKVFHGILPNLTIDITDLIDSTRSCFICDQPSVYECCCCNVFEGVLKEQGRLENFNNLIDFGANPMSFCEQCMHATHVEPYRQMYTRPIYSQSLELAVVPSTVTATPRVTMDLFAVICIETSHFVSFVKCGKDRLAPWVLFDSMGDYQQITEDEGCSIPQVRLLRKMGIWLDQLERFPQNIKDLMSANPPVMTKELKRLLSDPYICLYSVSQE